MKAGIVTGPGKIELGDIPIPEPGPYQALVKVLACGFCNGTDSKIMQGHWPGVDPFPVILGHETICEVVEAGEKARNLTQGTRVLQARVDGAPEQNIGTAWGGFVEYAIATDWQAILDDGLPLEDEFLQMQQIVPEGIDPAGAIMLITFKETWSALQHFGVPQGKPVLIGGDGPVGVSLAQFAARMGADPVMISGHHDDRLDLARQVGATHMINTRDANLVDEVRGIAPDGVALVVDAVGSNQLVQHGLDLLADGGKIGVYGYTDQREATFDWSRAPMRWSLDYLVVPQLERLTATHDPLIEMTASGDLAPRALVSHVLPFDEVQKAYELVQSREGFKVIVEIS